MTLNFDPSGELADVADGTETVTLKRRGSTPGAPGTTVTGALRRVVTTAEPVLRNRYNTRKHVTASGQVPASDVVWHLPADQLSDTPRLGDVILDSSGRRWTVLEVQSATLKTRWRCAARDVAVAYALDDTVTILKAVYEKGTVGAAQPTWQTWRTGVRARIQPAETEVETKHGARRTVTRYQIFLEEEVALDHNHRIRGADGTVYKIKSTLGAGRIGEPPTVDAEITTDV